MNNEALYHDLLDLYLNNFESGEGNYPTSAWLSGMFKKVQDFKNIEHFLDDEKILPERRHKLEKIKAFKEFAINHGLVRPTINGFYKITDKGSQLAQNLSSKIEQYKKFDAHRTPFGRTPEYKKMWYDFVAGVDQSDREWAQTLSETDSNFLKIYAELTPKEFSILKSLVKHGKTKTGIIRSIYDNSPDMFDKLVSTKFVNKNGTTNNAQLSAFFRFLGNTGYSKLKNFNKEISYTIDRSASDKALNKNYAERQFANSPRAGILGQKASSFIKSLDAETLDTIKKVFSDKKIPNGFKNFLIKNDIVDASNALTDFGKIVKYGLSLNKDLDSLEDRNYNFKYKSADEKENHPVPTKSERKVGLAGNRTRSFRDFMKRQH
jgi:hypothetical protein